MGKVVNITLTLVVALHDEETILGDGGDIKVTYNVFNICSTPRVACSLL